MAVAVITSNPKDIEIHLLNHRITPETKPKMENLVWVYQEVPIV